MPMPTKNNLFEGLPVTLIMSNEPKDSPHHFRKAHADLKKLLAEHSGHISGRTLDTFLDTLNTLKKGTSKEGD